MAESSEFSVGARDLDRGSPTPLWLQLEQELLRRTDQGDFQERFPTDRELMEIYEVSRHTARHAVGQLGADGIVRRARGIGTSVDRRTFERSLGSLYSLYQIVEEAGMPQRAEVRELASVRDAEAAHWLGLRADTELVYLERLRFAGRDPLAIDRVWLPASVAAPLLEIDFTSAGLYDQLERTVGRRPNAGWERINPAVPSAQERELLQLGDDEAVFSLERIGTFSGDPVEWRVTTIRGSRFSMVADWTAGQRNEIRLQMTALGR
jgi:GntR family transcriptional regulator